jgi:hypothetical protein
MACLARESSPGVCCVTARISPFPPRPDPARAGIRDQIGVLHHRVRALHGTIRHRQGRRPRLPGPRHRVDGQARKCRLLGSCRGQGQRGPWILPRAREAEAVENFLNHGGVVDRSDQPPDRAEHVRHLSVARPTRRVRGGGWSMARLPRSGQTRAGLISCRP